MNSNDKRHGYVATSNSSDDDKRTPQNLLARIENEPYYHGLLPREDIIMMLCKAGDFLVRTSEPGVGQARCFILSVMCYPEQQENGIKHFVMKKNSHGQFSNEKYSFHSIPELVHFHWSRNDPIMKSGEGRLRTPIIRQSWELSNDDIEVTRKLGEGAFGEVSLGKLKRMNFPSIDVAIKSAKLEALTKEQVKEIMHEARLMRSFDHPNVIRIYGVAALQEPLMIVMELASNGALDSFLKKNDVQVNMKCEMCAQASFGLEYLHTTCRVIHRDIAARNCLFGGGQVKISDFGMTVEGSSFQMDPLKRVPIRWLAPETLRTAIYTQKSDVFSYGILCWEVFANGTEPYNGMTVSEASQKVKDGYRMAFVEDAPSAISTMVSLMCWAENPDTRSTMVEVAKFWECKRRIARPDSKLRLKPWQMPASSGNHTPTEAHRKDGVTMKEKKSMKEKSSKEKLTSHEKRKRRKMNRAMGSSRKQH